MLRRCVLFVGNNLHKSRTRPFVDNTGTRQIHCGICFRTPRHTSKTNSGTTPALSSKYRVITDPDLNDNIESIYENEDSKYPVLSDEFDDINLKRGKNGVFEIEDLVELLQRENAKDIFVAAVAPEIRYVDYICVVSAKSKRHIKAVAEFVRRVYKKKCNANDQIPKIEGKESDEWMAIDLGNIALHVFSEKTRVIYDLETLWSVGAEYDEQTKKKFDVVDVFENYSTYLKDLKPLA